MNFKNEQDKFDVIKWYDSIVAGEDRCGSYDFCGVCNKEETDPCARAARRLAGEEVEMPTANKEACQAVCEELAVAAVEEEPRQASLTPILRIRLRVKKK